MRPELQMEMMPVASLAVYAANARMHPTEQVAQLAASIAEFGFNVPVLVSAMMSAVVEVPIRGQGEEARHRRQP